MACLADRRSHSALISVWQNLFESRIDTCRKGKLPPIAFARQYYLDPNSGILRVNQNVPNGRWADASGVIQ